MFTSLFRQWRCSRHFRRPTPHLSWNDGRVESSSGILGARHAQPCHPARKQKSVSGRPPYSTFLYLSRPHTATPPNCTFGPNGSARMIGNILCLFLDSLPGSALSRRHLGRQCVQQQQSFCMHWQHISMGTVQHKQAKKHVLLCRCTVVAGETLYA